METRETKRTGAPVTPPLQLLIRSEGSEPVEYAVEGSAILGAARISRSVVNTNSLAGGMLKVCSKTAAGACEIFRGRTEHTAKAQESTRYPCVKRHYSRWAATGLKSLLRSRNPRPQLQCWTQTSCRNMKTTI